MIEPNKLFLATVRGYPDELVWPSVWPSNDLWYSINEVDTFKVHRDHHLQNLRPAVVLDLEDLTSHLRGLEFDYRVRDLCAKLRLSGAWAVHRIVEAIEAQYYKKPSIPDLITKQIEGTQLNSWEKSQLREYANRLEQENT